MGNSQKINKGDCSHPYDVFLVSMVNTVSTGNVNADDETCSSLLCRHNKMIHNYIMFVMPLMRLG
jgi:hypothetical protein